MDQEIISRLRQITHEEQAILDGRTTIDRDLYMQTQSNTINSRKLLSSGKLITLRPHSRTSSRKTSPIRSATAPNTTESGSFCDGSMTGTEMERF